jgi:hypothetical protein
LLKKRTFKSGDHVDYYDVKALEATATVSAATSSAATTSPPST